jgi:hypothetical protein
MNAALETRIRAAGAEMSKPGRWRVALEQLDQATAQILASADADVQLLYQWSSVMSSQEFHRLNHAVMQLTELIAQASAKQ